MAGSENMDDLLTKENKKIEICEVDYMGEYQLYHLFNRFSEIATINAIKIGLWNQEMMGKYGWVVAKQTLHLEEPILYNDEIIISTLPGKASFVSFPRYYFINKKGYQIGYCSSLWTLIDLQRRRIVAPKRVGIQVPNVHHNLYLEEPQNINVNIPLFYIETRQVRYSDVDTNQHMNNTRYIQWALDIIDYHMHQDDFISDISIQYKKEIAPLTQVELYMGHDQLHYIIEGKQEDEVFFVIEVLFSKRCL